MEAGSKLPAMNGLTLALVSENHTFQDLKLNSSSPNYNQAVDRKLTCQLLVENIFLFLVFENKRYEPFQLFLIGKLAKKFYAFSHMLFLLKIEAETILTRRGQLFKAMTYTWVQAELFFNLLGAQP